MSKAAKLAEGVHTNGAVPPKGAGLFIEVRLPTKWVLAATAVTAVVVVHKLKRLPSPVRPPMTYHHTGGMP